MRCLFIIRANWQATDELGGGWPFWQVSPRPGDVRWSHWRVRMAGKMVTRKFKALPGSLAIVRLELFRDVLLIDVWT